MKKNITITDQDIPGCSLTSEYTILVAAYAFIKNYGDRECQRNDQNALYLS